MAARGNCEPSSRSTLLGRPGQRLCRRGQAPSSMAGVGIDLFRRPGPRSWSSADATPPDAEMCATDLLGQAEPRPDPRRRSC